MALTKVVAPMIGTGSGVSAQALNSGAPIYENTQTCLLYTSDAADDTPTVSATYTITSGSSAVSAGPISISSGVTVSVPSGSKWVVL